MSIRPRIRVLTAAVLLPVAVVFAAGCSMSQPNVAPGVAGTEAPVTVRVDNQYRNDVTIFAVRNNEEHRLGRVRSYNTARLRLPSTYVGTATPLYLRAEPIGGNESVDSEALFPEQGMTIVWSISNYLANSNLSVSH